LSGRGESEGGGATAGAGGAEKGNHGGRDWQGRKLSSTEIWMGRSSMWLLDGELDVGRGWGARRRPPRGGARQGRGRGACRGRPRRRRSKRGTRAPARERGACEELGAGQSEEWPRRRRTGEARGELLRGRGWRSCTGLSSEAQNNRENEADEPSVADLTARVFFTDVDPPSS
jgi:hypothetical protein